LALQKVWKRVFAMSCFSSVHLYFFETRDEVLASFLQEKIEEILPLQVVRVPLPLPLPTRAYDARRNQYAAEPFLKILLEQKSDFENIPLGLVERDLFEDGLNFVFGVALPFQVALVATARLHESFYGRPEDQDLYYKRVLKECMHELGHVFGLGHCPDPKCVMHFSNSLADTDYKSYLYCPRCFERVKRMICR
jgi:archaemetzincin